MTEVGLLLALMAVIGIGIPLAIAAGYVVGRRVGETAAELPEPVATGRHHQ